MLSLNALKVLADLFGQNSGLNLPTTPANIAAWARVVNEIEQWAAAQLAEQGKQD